ncbi:hypothetical protein OAX78_04560 [Planctomycetota bacterium]|nr:hypothetical protein [Planctomycetota bacterium]
MRHAAIIVLTTALAGWAVPAGAQQSLGPRTLGRTVDTIVVPGETLGSEILGAHKSKVRVYACRAGFMVPVTYQIDERNAAGTYCYTQGPRDRRTQDEDEGRVDANDELILLAREAGDRAHPNSFRMVPGYTAVAELQVHDPLIPVTTMGNAWYYVFRFTGPTAPNRLATDLVRLTPRGSGDDAHFGWRGERFFFHNQLSPENAVRATHVAFAPEGSRDVRGQPDLIDSTLVKAVVSFMWVEVVRMSSDIKIELGGYIDGPIRVVAENRMQVYLALGMWVSAPESYVMLWPNKVTMPTNANCPVNLDESGESSYSLCIDMSDQAQGWSFYNSRNATPVPIDGRTSRAERELDKGWPDWNCMFGPDGAIITKFVVPEIMLGADRESGMIYADDEFARRPEDESSLEFEPGNFGLNGFYLDMSGLEEGIYPGDYVVWYCPAPFVAGDHTQYLNEYDHPVDVTRTEAGR